MAVARLHLFLPWLLAGPAGGCCSAWMRLTNWIRRLLRSHPRHLCIERRHLQLAAGRAAGACQRLCNSFSIVMHSTYTNLMLMFFSSVLTVLVLIAVRHVFADRDSVLFCVSVTCATETTKSGVGNSSLLEPSPIGSKHPEGKDPLEVACPKSRADEVS